MLVRLSARIGAASALPPVANAEPDERVTRGEGLSAQFMAARGGDAGTKKREESRNVGEKRARRLSFFSFFRPRLWALDLERERHSTELFSWLSLSPPAQEHSSITLCSPV